MNEEIKKFLNDETYVLVYRSNYDRASRVNQMLIDYVKDLQKRIDKAMKLLEKHNCENCCDYNNMYALAELKDMKFDKENFELVNK